MNRRTSHRELATAFLPEAEQEAIIAAASGDAEKESLIRESFRLRAAVDAGRSLHRREVDDLMLALALPGSGREDSWRSRILVRDESEGGPEAATGVRHRLEALEAGLPAADHFARLTGHVVAPAPDRRWVWLAAASVIVLTIGHGLLARISEDPVRRAVWNEWAPPPPSRSAQVDPVQRARSLGRSARGTVLGLWPTYDAEILQEAEDILRGRVDAAAVLELARLKAVAGNAEGARELLMQLPAEAQYGREARQLLLILTPGDRE